MNLLKKFKEIRDIPYRIPLSLSENDDCCSGKHMLLKEYFDENWIESRYRVCSFLWSTISMPDELRRLPHNDYCTHVYLEVLIDWIWIDLDATWDLGIGDYFNVNEWNWKNNTKIALRLLKKFSIEESKIIMEEESEQDILDDLEKHYDFYKWFNEWLENLRTKKDQKLI